MKFYNLGIQPGFDSMTCFHALARLGQEALIMVSPQSPILSTGYFQEMDQVLDLVHCEELSLPILRREVGGGTVLLDQNQIFYQLILKRDNPLLPLGVEETYLKFSQPPINTYERLGVKVRFKPVNDLVTLEGKKISGEGGANIGECMVFVGSIILNFDMDLMSRVLRVPDEKFRDKVYKTLKENMSTLLHELGELPLRSKVEEILAEEWAKLLGPLEPQELSKEIQVEMKRVEEELTSEEFLWTPFKRTRQPLKVKAGLYLGQGHYKALGGLVTASVILQEGKCANVELSGDFSLNPKEGLVLLEQAVGGSKPDLESLERRLEQAITRYQLDLPGVSAKDIAQAIFKAISEAKE